MIRPAALRKGLHTTSMRALPDGHLDASQSAFIVERALSEIWVTMWAEPGDYGNSGKMCMDGSRDRALHGSDMLDGSTMRGKTGSPTCLLATDMQQ